MIGRFFRVDGAYDGSTINCNFLRADIAAALKGLRFLSAITVPITGGDTLIFVFGEDEEEGGEEEEE